MKGLLKSFVYAFCGIKNAVLTERNFRIHLTAIVFVLYFSLVYGLSRGEYAILLLTMILVPALELVNTALEKCVDLATREKHPLAKTAKDSAAAAVLLAAIGAVGIAVALFSDPEKLKRTLTTLCTLPHLPIVLSLICLGILFIFFLKKKN